MQNNKVVSREEWLVARKEHLAKEKEFTRLRDELSQQRRELPWVKVDKEYIFEGPNGKETLAELFSVRSQLLVYHFMFGPDWEEGCPSCSFWADNYDGIIQHLNHRDVTMVTISRAPLDQLRAYRKRIALEETTIERNSALARVNRLKLLEVKIPASIATQRVETAADRVVDAVKKVKKP